MIRQIQDRKAAIEMTLLVILIFKKGRMHPR